MRKIILLSTLFIISQFISTNVNADIVSLSSAFVNGGTDVVSKLNDDRNKLTNGVNNIRGVYSGGVQSSGQIKSATVGEENLYADASPRVYLDEIFINGKLGGSQGIIGTKSSSSTTGLVYSTSLNLTSSASPGVAFVRGYRIDKTSSSPHTFSAGKWTYSFICSDGSFSFLERNIGTELASSEYPASCTPLSRVSSDTSRVVSVKDLRTTSFIYQSYDAVYDADTESSLKELLVANGNPYKVGAILKYKDASSFTVTAGSAMITGEARDRVSFDSDPSWPVSSASDQDGLDVGTRANNTKYYVYLTADEENTRTYRVVQSPNDVSPAGKSKYLKIGEFRNGTGVISRDSVISYINGENLLPEKRQLNQAWAFFDGTSSPLIVYSSYGVSSIIDNGTGDYTVVLENGYDSAYGYTAISHGNEGQECETQKPTSAIRPSTANSVSIYCGSWSGGAAQDAYPKLMVTVENQ